jgi:hypothetical protein
MPNGKSKRNGNGNSPQKSKRNGNNNGNGKRVTNPLLPRARPRYLAANSENSRPVRNRIYPHAGSDFVGVVKVRAGAVGSERILHSWPITPSAFPGTRLTQFAALYEFFKFTKLHLRYVPAVPVTVACQLCLYVDLDPKDDPTIITNPDALVRQAVAQTGAQQWNFHTPKCIPLAMRTDQQYYFTGEDKENVRFTRQGIAYLIQITDPVDVNGAPITTDLEAGSIFFDWAVNFNIPQINPESTVLAVPLSSDKKLYVTPNVDVDWNPSWIPDSTGKSTVLLPRKRYVVRAFVNYIATTLFSQGRNLTVRAVDGSTIAAITFTSTDPSNISSATTNFILETDDKGFPKLLPYISLPSDTSTKCDEIGFEIIPLDSGTKFPVTFTGSKIVEP